VGDFEASIQVEVESSVEYHPVILLILTLCCYLYFEISTLIRIYGFIIMKCFFNFVYDPNYILISVLEM